MNADDYETLPTDNVSTHMIAGAIAGVMEHCVMYPLDSVKTRMQSLATTGSDGIAATFIKMVRQEGMFRPIRGMGAMVLGAGPSHALYFSTYEFLKSTFTEMMPSTKYHTLCYGAAGCISTLLHDGVMNPAEVIKQRMQMFNSPYRSVLGCLQNVYRTEGIGAFYRSYTTQLTMNIPFQSIHFMVYEFAQTITNKERQYNPAAHMVSGAMAGAVAAAVTTPLDVCKTQLNTQPDLKSQGLIQTMKLIYRLKGVRGYFRGMQARIMYQMPSTAICWSTYEFFKYLLGSTQELRIVAPTSNVLAEEKESCEDDFPGSTTHFEKITFKSRESGVPRELPAMSGAGLYGSISFNTMHKADYRQKDSLLDVART
ncbi:mitoferrin-1-like [Anthonomus grandis grandis]|uniref:mitoferrin-1-like n=1 Tax=Anthonomus grandis grandis TaxID=2921223 RepID=UPI0021653CA2|nr:mitoferrin-1-like [Anthonomus grandis grandis]